MTAFPASRHLVRQTAGAVPWAAFFIVAPFLEFVLVGAALWVPLLILRERRRTERYGFWPGALCRASLVAVVVTTAILAPTGPDDRVVGGLPGPTVTLGQLNASGVIFFASKDKELERVALTLPSPKPTRRQVAEAIKAQTGLRASTIRCGNGATLLFGAHSGPISVHDPRALSERQVTRQRT